MNIQHRSNIILSGPSGCGKTTLVRNLIKQIAPPVEHVIYCYNIPLEWFKEESYQYHEGIIKDWDVTKKTAIVLDDLMNCIDANVSDLFLHKSHHMNATVFILTQNLFCQNPHYRNISLNSHYFFLFNSRRDINQIACLNKQMYPHKPKYLLDAFLKATQDKYKYLCIDLKPNTPEDLRVRSDVLPGERNLVYLPK